MATNAFVVEYAQEARSYSLVLFLVTLSSYCFTVELQEPSRLSRIGFVVSSALAVYAHYFAIYVLLAQLAVLVAVERRAALSRRWMTQALLIGALAAPTAIAAAHLGHSQISWIPRPTATTLWRASAQLAGRHWALLAAAPALAACAAANALWTGRWRWQLVFVAAWLVFPVALSVGSYLETMFYPRYLIVSVPALALLTGAGVASIPSRAVGVAAVALLVVLSAFQVAHWYLTDTKEDWRDASAYVLGQQRRGDRAVFISSGVEWPVDYYASLAGGESPAPVGVAAEPATTANRVWLILSLLPSGAGRAPSSILSIGWRGATASSRRAISQAPSVSSCTYV